MTETERKNYRTGHSSDKTGEWRAQGYDYDSDAAWKNYKNIGRFLQLQYTRNLNGQTEDGEVQHGNQGTAEGTQHNLYKIELANVELT